MAAGGPRRSRCALLLFACNGLLRDTRSFYAAVRKFLPHFEIGSCNVRRAPFRVAMDDILKAARRATAATKLLEAAKPVPKKQSELQKLQKRFDQLVGTHTQTEALLAAGGGDLPASLPPSRMAPEAAPSLPLPPRSAGGTLCYAIGEQPGVERGPRLRLQPSISTPALRRHATQPWASEPQPCVFRLHSCAL